MSSYMYKIFTTTESRHFPRKSKDFFLQNPTQDSNLFVQKLNRIREKAQGTPVVFTTRTPLRSRKKPGYVPISDSNRGSVSVGCQGSDFGKFGVGCDSCGGGRQRGCFLARLEVPQSHCLGRRARHQAAIATTATEVYQPCRHTFITSI